MGSNFYSYGIGPNRKALEPDFAIPINRVLPVDD